MPKPRRKTLSHSEIESFLSEISTVTNEINNQVDNFFNLEDINEPSLSALHQPVTHKPQPAPTSNADLIREFCKLHFQQNAVNHQNKHDQLHPKSKDLARQIFQNTKYKLVTSRVLNPDDFLHPIESLEGKKSLIVSLTPMLTDAEEQRKRDTQECEEITRCKSNKIRGRSSYEYIDIDTYQKVDFDEYEMRYMLFINRNKPKKVHLPPKAPAQPQPVLTTRASPLRLSCLAPIPLPSPAPTQATVTVSNSEPTQPPQSVVEEDKENSRIRANRQMVSSSNLLTEADKKLKKKPSDRKRKLTNPNAGHNLSSRSNDRRGTLSPASARAMALKAMEEEAEKQSESVASVSAPVPPAQSFLSPVKLQQEIANAAMAEAANAVPFEDIDLISFDDDVPASLSRRDAGRRKSASMLFTVTEEEIALISGLATSSSAPTLTSPSQQPLVLMPVEPNIPHPKKRSPLISRTPVKSPLEKLSDHLTTPSHKITPVTTPMNNNNNTSNSNSKGELISMEADDISILTSNHTRTIDFFGDDVLIPTNSSLVHHQHQLHMTVPSSSSSSNTTTVALVEDSPSTMVVSPLSVPMNIIEEEETLMMMHDSTPIHSSTISMTSSITTTTSSSSTNCCLEDRVLEEEEGMTAMMTVNEYHESCSSMSNSYFLEDLPDSLDEQAIELQAKRRLHERFMIARNQFQWELVSAQAVNSAILRAKSKYSNKQHTTTVRTHTTSITSTSHSSTISV